MYHSVGRRLPDWRWAQRLTIPADAFEDHLKWLVKSGYQTVGLDELHAHVSGASALPARSVVLTFDDGYLDNWTFVTPLLKKYGLRGTILVLTDFVQADPVVRPTLEDVWAGRLEQDDLDVRGFMSWAELKAVSDMGVLNVQSHACTHAWYPVGPEIVDFHHPDDAYYWLDWNAFPEAKPFYLKTPGSSRVPLGTPIYEHSEALRATRFFPDDAESAHLTAFVSKNGGEHFFERSGWRDTLFAEVADYRKGAKPTGRYETNEERSDRYHWELTESKRIIEKEVGANVDYLVWPSHAYNEESMQCAREIYKAYTIDPAEGKHLGNRAGEDPQQFVRMGVPLIRRGDRLFAPGGRYLIKYLDEFRGNMLAKRTRQILKRVYLAASRLGVWP
jgi:peptidoglycan/xylan/chitin deacetylase (PgdA/CDA1 family)